VIDGKKTVEDVFKMKGTTSHNDERKGGWVLLKKKRKGHPGKLKREGVARVERIRPWPDKGDGKGEELRKSRMLWVDRKRVEDGGLDQNGTAQ